MTYMPDEIVWARMITALDLEFEKALHYNDEGYENNNDYELPAQVMRPVQIYSVSTTMANFNLADYEEAQYTTSPSHPDDPGMACPSVKGSTSI